MPQHQGVRLPPLAETQLHGVLLPPSAGQEQLRDQPPGNAGPLLPQLAPAGGDGAGDGARDGGAPGVLAVPVNTVP